MRGIGKWQFSAVGYYVNMMSTCSNFKNPKFRVGMSTDFSGRLITLVLKQIEANGHCSSDDADILCTLTNDMELLNNANELVVKKKITKVQAEPSGRSFYRVKGSSAANYLSYAHYCTCPSFFHTSSKYTHAMCKHSLAILLAESFGLLEMQLISDAEYATKLRFYLLSLPFQEIIQ